MNCSLILILRIQTNIGPSERSFQLEFLSEELDRIEAVPAESAQVVPLPQFTSAVLAGCQASEVVRSRP